MKKLLKIDTIIAIIGLCVSIVGIVGRWDLTIASIVSSSGIIIFVWASINLSLEFGEPFIHLKYIWTVKIFDALGKKSTAHLSHLLKVRRKRVNDGGLWWSCYPHNLKVYIAFCNDNPDVLNKIPIQHGEPEKRGGMFFSPIYHNPPLRRGQKVWIIYEFEIVDEFIENRISDFFDSNRKIKKFIWKFHLPSDRPAKRWFGSADFLPNKSDRVILFEDFSETTDVTWEFMDTKVGAVYYITIDW
jgi:hypothetical protein